MRKDRFCSWPMDRYNMFTICSSPFFIIFFFLPLFLLCFLFKGLSLSFFLFLSFFLSFVIICCADASGGFKKKIIIIFLLIIYSLFYWSYSVVFRQFCCPFTLKFPADVPDLSPTVTAIQTNCLININNLKKMLNYAN